MSYDYLCNHVAIIVLIGCVTGFGKKGGGDARANHVVCRHKEGGHCGQLGNGRLYCGREPPICGAKDSGRQGVPSEDMTSKWASSRMKTPTADEATNAWSSRT